jgi:hypothetical protein
MVLLGIVLTGCGGSEGPPATVMADVSGKVTVTGKPLQTAGVGIGFATSSTASDVMTIDENGAFSGKAPVGLCKVTIIPIAQTAPPSTVGEGTTPDQPATPDGGHTVPTDSGILDTFLSEAETTLSADVQADVANTFDFEVGQ